MFLSGRTLSSVKSVERDVVSAGGVAHAAEVDASNGPEVDDYVASLVRRAGAPTWC